MKSHFGHGERVFTFPGAVAQDGKGGLGKVRGCRAGPVLFLDLYHESSWVSGFTSALEMTTLWKNWGALKMGKENENKKRP